MKTMLFGLCLSLVMAYNCYGFETGTWELMKNPEGLEGGISIQKDGKNYKVELSIEYLLSRGSYGFCLLEGDGIGKEIN